MTDDHQNDRLHLTYLTADIVARYVQGTPVRIDEIGSLIGAVHAGLAAIEAPTRAEPAPVPRPVPAVPIKKSVMADHLICLDDGKKFKSLKRHLATLGMTPDSYRAKWGLPDDYPMVAPDYASKRSDLARAMGLGRKPTMQ